MIFHLPHRNKLIKGAVVSIVCISFGSWIPRQFTENTSCSLPQRLFALNKHVSPESIKSGDIVRFPFNNAVTKGPVHLLKRVGCNQGQLLTVNDQKEYFCDGKWLGKAKDKLLSGQPVENFKFNGLVPPGKFFALADHKDSYDSRYFGFVELSQVVAKAYPIF